MALVCSPLVEDHIARGRSVGLCPEMDRWHVQGVQGDLHPNQWQFWQIMIWWNWGQAALLQPDTLHSHHLPQLSKYDIIQLRHPSSFIVRTTTTTTTTTVLNLECTTTNLQFSWAKTVLMKWRHLWKINCNHLLLRDLLCKYSMQVDLSHTCTIWQLVGRLSSTCWKSHDVNRPPSRKTLGCTLTSWDATSNIS